MHAKQGDQIVIDTTTLDALRRHGEVIEVIGQGEREHYRIRWQDGHESVYFPVWVPESRRTSCDLLILVEEAAEAVASVGLVDLGCCATGEWS
jgi:hypothetical protein